MDETCITLSDINNLNNGNKLPVVFSITCKTGGFLQQNVLLKSFWTFKRGAVGFLLHHKKALVAGMMRWP